MMIPKMHIIAAVIAAFLFAAVVPTVAYAQAPDGSLTLCVEIADGDKEIFLECVVEIRGSLQEKFNLPDGWFDRLSTFVDEHPDWAARIRRIADRLEDRWDRREDRGDRLENRYDRHEDYRDRAEDFRDRWEDRQDEEFNLEDLFDRFEDRRDQRGNRWDRRENRFDKREDLRDRFEDRRDNRWPPEA